MLLILVPIIMTGAYLVAAGSRGVSMGVIDAVNMLWNWIVPLGCVISFSVLANPNALDIVGLGMASVAFVLYAAVTAKLAALAFPLAQKRIWAALLVSAGGLLIGTATGAVMPAVSQIGIPWAVWAGGYAYAVLTGAREHQRKIRAMRAACAACGYSLAELADSDEMTCPECGRDVRWGELRQV